MNFPEFSSNLHRKSQQLLISVHHLSAEFFIFQQDNASGHEVVLVNFLDTKLLHSSHEICAAEQLP